MSDDAPFAELAAYLGQLMAERGFDSQRAFARAYDLPRQTLRRLLNGQRVDPESLAAIAEGLDLPVETFYQLCGYLPTGEQRSRLLAEVEDLLRGLDRAQQERIRDLVREEVERVQETSSSEAATPQEKTA